eukprot:scaffold39516_cov29-Tisochrysis_lutea.AAC.1
MPSHLLPVGTLTRPLEAEDNALLQCRQAFLGCVLALFGCVHLLADRCLVTILLLWRQHSPGRSSPAKFRWRCLQGGQCRRCTTRRHKAHKARRVATVEVHEAHLAPLAGEILDHVAPGVSARSIEGEHNAMFRLRAEVGVR